MAVAIARPAVATTVGRPRRSSAASSTSSCTSVAEWISSTATIARSTRSGCSGDGPAASSTSSGRSRLPPAAIVALACSASTVPVRAGELHQPLLELVHQPRHVRAAGRDHRRYRLRARHHATVPECSAMIPPAVRIQRTSRSPASCSSAPSGCGPGNRFTELGRYV